MTELKTYSQMHQWAQGKEQVGFIDSSACAFLQTDIWTIGLWKQETPNTTKCYLQITLEDDTILVCQFEDVATII